MEKYSGIVRKVAAVYGSRVTLAARELRGDWMVGDDLIHIGFGNHSGVDLQNLLSSMKDFIRVVEEQIRENGINSVRVLTIR